jgi:50S ribosomal subunit-associated GTPase HflX
VRIFNKLVDRLNLLRSYLSARASHDHRILRWELPRLLAAIERLAASVKIETGRIAVGVDKGEDGPRLIQYRQDRLSRQLDEVMQSSERIRSLLGY